MAEAKAVRTIFERYLALGSVRALADDLIGRGIRSKLRKLSNGRTIGGGTFGVGALAYLLKYFVTGSTAMPISIRKRFEQISGVRVLNSYHVDGDIVASSFVFERIPLDSRLGVVDISQRIALRNLLLPAL
jgi:hypothetical protein